MVAVGQFQSDTAEILYERFSESIFQVRIVDIKSGSQSAIGTGFLIENGRLLATNYHVVSALIDKPKQYRAEIVINHITHVLSLQAFDVVNDLAILAPIKPQRLGDALTLWLTPPSQGETLYSIGNPHDIGMTVVEGTYNGYVDHRFIDLIHFSGSINPGMSGGPAINREGNVVGINVATSGEQIGFLVPVTKLQSLIERQASQSDAPLFEQMQRQLTDFSDTMINKMLSTEWPLEKMGEAYVVGKILPMLECWGNSNEGKETGLNVISKGCSNRENIYINNAFRVGKIEYEFEYNTVDNWSPTSFYGLLSKKQSRAGPGNYANKDNVHNYRCHTDVLGKHADSTTNVVQKKVNYCVRDYKKISGLYDVFYLSTSIDKKRQAITEHYTLSGVSSEAAQRFLNRFVGVVKWQ